MYNILFFGLLVAIIQSVNGVSVEARFVSTDLLIIAGTAITIISLFGQKLMLMWNEPTTHSSTSSNSKNTTATTTPATLSEEDNNQMRIRLETLEDQVDLLRESLATWKNDHEMVSKENQILKAKYNLLKKKYCKATGEKLVSENSQELVNLVDDNASDIETTSSL
eukprot:TRINITY_DN2948_c0_g2_i2.p1 TRINITY_DN2948_c0_g2~~TRINITY_DN2948_c0_g2_i2.p1  ORF type:complete len:166 (+),score=30.14 TRINITY_DN2948_c0_g2_i2:315-812(+)